MRKRIVSLIFLYLALMLCSVASAYPDTIDHKISHYIFLETQLHEKQVFLKQKQQDFLTQKKQLDVEGAQLAKHQETYNKSANQFNMQADEHNQKIAEASQKCQSFGPRKNLDQLAAAADAASANLSNFVTTNPDARQQEEYVRKCNAGIMQVNTETLRMVSDKSSLLSQQDDLVKQTANYKAKVATWNQHEVTVVSTLNDIYKEISSWQNDAEDFMQSDEFQRQITWARANKTCTTPDIGGTPQERMTEISNYILVCLNTVENARRHFYAHYDAYLKKWYPGYYRALHQSPGGGGL